MRRALLVVGILILAAPAWAGGGFSLFGSYSEIVEDAEAPGVGVRVSIGGKNWVGDLTWTWLQKQEDVNTFDLFVDEVQVIPTDLGIRYLFNTNGSFKPYLGAGATFFYTNVNTGNAENAFGGYGMLGFNLGRGRTTFFAEGIYRFGSTDVEYRYTVDQITSGSMDVGGWGVNVGVAWGF